MTHPENRNIRSYVLRQGRLTSGQKKAIDQTFDQYALDPETVLDPGQVFGNNHPLILEIGFGDGQALEDMAARYPEKNFIGIEVHTPGVGSLLLRLQALQLKNVRLYQADAFQVLTHLIPDHSLSELLLFFPDPWPKKRHHKRRLVQSGFVDLIHRKLLTGGLFHFATDWEPYALHVQALFHARGDFSAAIEDDSMCKRPATKFEKRGLRLGHGVWDLFYRT